MKSSKQLLANDMVQKNSLREVPGVTPSSIHATLIYRQILFCVIEWTKHRHMIVLGREQRSHISTHFHRKKEYLLLAEHICVLVPVRRSGTRVEETTPDFSRRRDDVGKRKENGITTRSTTRDISTSFSPARPFILAPPKWISCCFQRFVLSGKTNLKPPPSMTICRRREVCLNVSSGVYPPCIVQFSQH